MELLITITAISTGFLIAAKIAKFNPSIKGCEHRYEKEEDGSVACFYCGKDPYFKLEVKSE